MELAPHHGGDLPLVTLLPGTDPWQGPGSQASHAGEAQRVRRAGDVVGPGLFFHSCSRTVLDGPCSVPTAKLPGGINHGIQLSPETESGQGHLQHGAAPPPRPCHPLKLLGAAQEKTASVRERPEVVPKAGLQLGPVPSQHRPPPLNSLNPFSSLVFLVSPAPALPLLLERPWGLGNVAAVRLPQDRALCCGTSRSRWVSKGAQDGPCW